MTSGDQLKSMDMACEDPRRLRRRVAQLKEEWEQEKAKLELIEKACKHDWTEPVYDPIIHEAYRDPGDPPGTMGVDRRLPMDVPRQEIKRWFRECKRCGKIEWTERTRQKVTDVPAF